jgi:DNA-binding Lrp family transcriptional regulator
MNIHNNEQKSNLEGKILNELQKNCKLKLTEIGKKCGCSRYKVGRVIKELEENKIIIGYSAITNPNEMNLKYYILLVKRTSLPLSEDIVKKLPVGKFTDLLPEINIKIKDTLYVHGYYDWVITFTADNISKAKELCNRILEGYSKYIESVELLELVLPLRLDGIRIYQPEQKSKIL